MENATAMPMNAQENIFDILDYIFIFILYTTMQCKMIALVYPYDPFDTFDKLSIALSKVECAINSGSW